MLRRTSWSLLLLVECFTFASFGLYIHAGEPSDSARSRSCRDEERTSNADHPSCGANLFVLFHQPRIALVHLRSHASLKYLELYFELANRLHPTRSPLSSRSPNLHQLADENVLVIA